MAAALSFDPIIAHVALYCRISEDITGLADGVDTQEHLGRAFAAETFPGLPVVVYTDNDLTAADDDVYRPAFERMRADIATGRVAQVWAVEQTRLCRTYRWFTFGQELERAGIAKVHTRRDGIIEVGELAADVGAVVSIHEVKKMKKRIRDKQDAAAAKGRPSGARVFGYRHTVDADGRKALEVVPEQAEIIKEAARRILDGEPRTAIARDLTARGVRGVTGAKVGANTVSGWFKAATVAGLRQHRGDLLRDETGELVRGTWPAILEVETWEAVRHKIAATSAKRERPANRRYLLSGLLRCEAGHRMAGTMVRRSGRNDTARYHCPDCGIGMAADAVDEHVTDRLLDRLDHLAGRLAEDTHAARRAELNRELTVVAERRKAATRKFARDDTWDEDDYDEFVAALAERKAELSRELAEMPAAVGAVDTEAVRKAWSVGTVDERREIAALWIGAVTVARAQPGASRLTVDLGRVTITGPGWDD